MHGIHEEALNASHRPPAESLHITNTRGAATPSRVRKNPRASIQQSPPCRFPARDKKKSHKIAFIMMIFVDERIREAQ